MEVLLTTSILKDSQTCFSKINFAPKSSEDCLIMRLEFILYQLYTNF